MRKSLAEISKEVESMSNEEYVEQLMEQQGKLKSISTLKRSGYFISYFIKEEIDNIEEGIDNIKERVNNLYNRLSGIMK